MVLHLPWTANKEHSGACECSASRVHKHSPKLICVHRHWCNAASDDVNSVLLHTWACLLSVLWAKKEKGGKIIHQKNFEDVSGGENRDIYPNFYESEYFQRSGKYQTVISKNSIVSYAFKAFNNIIYTQNILNS